MTKNDAIKAAKGLFKDYPSVNDFHFTTDGQAFAQKGDAESHSTSLDKKNPVVISVNRDDREEKENVELSDKELAEKRVADAKKKLDAATKALEKATGAKKAGVQAIVDSATIELATAETLLAEFE